MISLKCLNGQREDPYVLQLDLLMYGIPLIFYMIFNYKSFDKNFLSSQLGPKFMKEKGLKHVIFSSADGALEAAPAVRPLS